MWDMAFKYRAPNWHRLIDRFGYRMAVDRTTGLCRQAEFVAAAERELARAGRFGRPAALATLRLDSRLAFSQRATRQFTDNLRQQTRGFDLVGCSTEGDILLLLPEVTSDDVTAVIDRLQQAVAASFSETIDRLAIPVPFQVGIAAFPTDGLLFKELYSVAHERCLPMANPAPPTDQSVTPQPTEPSNLHYFVAAVVGTGLGILITALPHLTPTQLGQLLPLLLLAILAERLTRLDYGETAISMGGLITIAAAALGGIAGGALAGCGSGLGCWWVKRQPPSKGLMNTSMFALAGAGAGLPYWLLGTRLPLEWWPTVLLPGVLAGLLYFTINTLLLATVVALASGTSWRRQWQLRFGWQLLHFGVIGLIGQGMVTLIEQYGLTGLLLAVGPILLIHISQWQYIRHTVSHVTELLSLNSELTVRNDQLGSANERLEQALIEIRQAHQSILGVLSEALEWRDEETQGHSQRVVYYAEALALALGVPGEEIRTIVQGALLHDIGKIGVSDTILRKPGKLTDDEWAQMRRHPEIGYQMIQHIPFLAPSATLVRYHHERWDGRGYPAGLTGANIPLGARIFAVVDSFDAMTSDRPYRPGRPWDDAAVELLRCSGTQYDPAVVTTFVKLLKDGQLSVLTPAHAPAGAIEQQPGQPSTPMTVDSTRSSGTSQGPAAAA